MRESHARFTPALFEALAEVGRYEGRNRLYWWRRASMRKLEALGLVEQWLPPSVVERPRMKARPYRITATGRAALLKACVAEGVAGPLASEDQARDGAGKLK